eukprot:1157351-Pelagomonas_calceolata.AAC.5
MPTGCTSAQVALHCPPDAHLRPVPSSACSLIAHLRPTDCIPTACTSCPLNVHLRPVPSRACPLIAHLLPTPAAHRMCICSLCPAAHAH